LTDTEPFFHLSHQRNQGMALVLILVFTAALMVLGAAIITFAVNEKLIANYNALDIRLYYIAEAGLEAGIAVLQEDFYETSVISGTMGGGSYNVSFISIDTYSRDIVSVGELNGYTRTLYVTMELLATDDNRAVFVRQWHKPYPLRNYSQ
jgi:hypothetical protein